MPLEIAAFLGGMSVLIGALGVMLALGAGDERTEFDRVPRENCSDLLDPDRLDRELQAMVTARVASDEPLTAPLTGRPSVYYELEISVLQKHRSHNSDTGQYEERVSYEHYSREGDWAPGVRLEDGLEKTYRWIYDRIRSGQKALA